MGYDLNRFIGQVDDELICPICTGVLDDPLQVPNCEHAFCRSCITKWLAVQPVCPVDRQTVTISQLKQAPRILRSFLSRLNVSCDNKSYGCTMVMKLEMLAGHLSKCEYNRKETVPCEGCGCAVLKYQLKDHNCIREMRGIIQKNQQQIHKQQLEINELRRELLDAKMNLILMKQCMALVDSSPSIRAMKKEIKKREVAMQWSNTLSLARVTDWNCVVLTPDEFLKNSIRAALVESGCPKYILESLMKNCCEQNWPRGLCSLEFRQNNQRHYENYVFKRIPGKQAVLVLYVNNMFLEENMIVNPGFVMIFAYGID